MPKKGGQHLISHIYLWKELRTQFFVNKRDSDTMKRQVTICELLEDPDFLASDIMLTNSENPTEDILIKSVQSEQTAIRRAITRNDYQQAHRHTGQN